MKILAVSPALDIRNVFWLLAAMTFVVAPHIPRLPEWVGVFCLLIVGWRAWIAWKARRFPPRWIIYLLTIGAGAATFVSHKAFFGRDAGVTLLILMIALKLLEMRTQREVLLAINLGFFLVMTNFLFSQSIPLGIYMLLCVWIFIATLVGFNRTARPATLRERLVPAALLLGQALPVMIIVFVLFPRATGPLWALPQDARAGVSGLSDSMTPGNISRLIQSDALAFRVEFEQGIPPYYSLYWRGPVLANFDGRTWRAGSFDRTGSLEYSRKEKPWNYAVTIEPHGKQWIFALDAPAVPPAGSYALDDLQLRSRRPVDTRMRFEVRSWLDYRYGEHLPGLVRKQNLSLGDGRNPRTIALGRQWAQETPDPKALVRRAMQFYNSQFVYTLEPPELDLDRAYDQFLFEAKRGFCEHYAGSFALLMRAAGVPARVVTGYQGGEVNPLNNELLVRQADAHAWAEVWLEGEGWVRVDPTSAVSPTRIEGGVNAALGPIGVIPSLISYDPLGILNKLRFTWDAMNSQWNTWVLGYNVDRQRQFLMGLGMEDVDWKTLGLWLVVVSFMLVGVLSLALVVRDLPRKREPALGAWENFCAKLAAAGVVRAPHEGPLDFLDRARAAKPAIAADAEAITERYVEARYGEGATKAQLRELTRRVRAFRPA
jgi:protein-glutamine gamma-glutamyltransferase